MCVCVCVRACVRVRVRACVCVRASYVTHHIGACMHRLASILIAPHRDNGKREDNDILIAQVALRI